MIKTRIQTFTGDAARPYQDDLGRLRIDVFREFPYLYEGDLNYEKEYLAGFLNSASNVIVLAFAEDRIVGASTGIPLLHAPLEVQSPWEKANLFPMDQIYYFGESVLLKGYRGQGIGVTFFEEREKWARQQGFDYATFCGVLRSNNHPMRPPNYQPLNQFWMNRGYQLSSHIQCAMQWKDIGEDNESKKTLQFWHKSLK